MADFIISPYAISFNSIKEALESYISNKSNVTTTWQDFYTAGAGQTVLELDAALGAFYAFHFIIGRRESYLPTAMNYNSVLGGAQALGYNASRGHNLYLTLKLIPSVTQTIPKSSSFPPSRSQMLHRLKSAMNSPPSPRHLPQKQVLI